MAGLLSGGNLVQVLKVVTQGDTGGIKDVFKEMDNLDDKTSKAGASFGKLALAGGALGGTALVAGLGASAKIAMDFQQSIANVGSVTGATKDELAQLREEALKVGKDTSKSASESVEAFGELLKAGLSVKDVVGGAGRTVVQLAEATGQPVASMATLLSNSLNTFQLGADKAGDVANTLARAANASAIDVSDLGQSLQAVGPVASQAGLTMDQFATAMGIMGNHALKGSDAGTSLKTMLLSLTAPTDKAKAILQDLGVSVFDSEGKTRDFRDILGDLQGAFKDMQAEQKTGLMKDIFGTDAIRAANILVGEGVEGWDKFTNKMAEAPSVEDMSIARLNTLAGRIETLKGSLETVAIVVGEKLLPALMKMAEGATKGVGWLLEADWSKVAGPLMDVAAGIQGAFGWLVDHEEVLGGLAAMLLTAMVPGFIAWTVATLAQIQAQIALRAAQLAALPAMIAANAPLLLIVATVGLLVAGIILLVKHWDTITEKFPILGKVADAVKAALEGFVGWITGTAIPALGKLAAWFTDLGTTVVDAVQGALPAITGAGKSLIDGFFGGIQAGWDAAKAFFTNMPSAIGAFFTDVGNWLKEAGGLLIEGMKLGFEAWWTVYAKPWLYILDKVLDVMGDVGPWLKDKGGDLIGGLKAGWDEFWEREKQGWINITEKVNAVIGDTALWLLNKGKDLLKGLKDGWDEFWEREKRGWLNIADKSKEVIGDVTGTLTGKGKDLIKGLKQGFDDAWDTGVDAAKNFWTNLVKPTGGTIVGFFGNAKSLLTGAGKDLIDGLITGVGNAEQNLANAMARVLKVGANAGITVLNSQLGGFEGLVNGLKGAVNWVSDKLGLGALIPGNFGLPRIPQLATGTSFFPGGYAIVGEQGRELAKFPRGTEVIPHDRTEAILAGTDFALPPGIGGPLPGVDRVVNAVKGAGSFVKDFVKEWAGKGAGALLDTALNATGFKMPGNDLFGFMKQFMTSMKNELVDVIRGWLSGASDAIKETLEGWQWPVPPIVNQEYGPASAAVQAQHGYSFHTGIDLHAVRGQAVRAANTGTVALAGWNGGLGNSVAIDHPGGYRTVYGHFQSIMTKIGELVDSSKTIGLADSTGNSSGDHLHYETWKNGSHFNPRDIMPKFGGGGLAYNPVPGWVGDVTEAIVPLHRFPGMKSLMTTGATDGGVNIERFTINNNQPRTSARELMRRAGDGLHRRLAQV